MNLEFYRGKRVFVTGHTVFKGSWLCRMLVGVGAVVTGYSLEPPTTPNLFSLAGLEGKMTSVIGDIRNFAALKAAFDAAQPEIVLHLAAQPIVRDSYKDPRYTYETNVMGTVNLLECVRTAQTPPRSVLNVTTDKVYQNNEWCWGYRENEPLDGFDPYSNSKSCSELVTHSYKNSFFADGSVVEKEMGVEVIRPDIAGLMGAYGAALYGLRQSHKNNQTTSAMMDEQELESFAQQVVSVKCGGCGNHCQLTVNTFADGRKFISGNRCDKPVTGKSEDNSLNLYAYKQQLLASYKPVPGKRGSIGIPLCLGFYELLPFWYAFWTSLGFAVHTSPVSTRGLYLAGQATIPSDTACFPT